MSTINQLIICTLIMILIGFLLIWLIYKNISRHNNLMDGLDEIDESSIEQ